jgi:S1-C subfamily serine protease
MVLNGRPVASTLDLIDRLDRLPADMTVELGINRSRGGHFVRLGLSLCTGT